MTHITIADIDPVTEYTAGAGEVNFDIPWPFFTDASLKVYQTPNGQDPDDTNDLLTLTTDYAVTGAGNEQVATRRITLTSGATAGDKIVIQRDEPISRSSDLAEQGAFSSETYNDEQDKELMILQQLRSDLGRTLQSGVTGGNFDAGSKKIENVTDPTAAQDVATKAYADSLVTGAGITSGSFTPSWGGFSSAPSSDITWYKVPLLNGRFLIVISFDTLSGLQGASNSTGMSIINLPSEIIPASTVAANVSVVDSSSYRKGLARIIPAGTITFFVDFVTGTNISTSQVGFTASGFKGMSSDSSSFMYVM